MALQIDVAANLIRACPYPSETLGQTKDKLMQRYRFVERKDMALGFSAYYLLHFI